MRRRADVVLAERGFFESRERAKAAILAGHVRVDGRVVTKAGEQIAEDVLIEVTEVQRYVSRGGKKLEGALAAFGFDPTGLHAVDIGASTGGFTDCLLQAGAESVVAIDVGYGQLAWKLRQDPRVEVLERTNIRDVDPEQVGAPFDLAVIDVSFISLGKILDRVFELVGPHGTVLALVKPQFEAGKGRVGKKGVVRDSSTHEDVVRHVLDEVRVRGRGVRGLTWSPLRGPEGNIEFWAWIGAADQDIDPDPHEIVISAHAALGE